MTPPLVSVLMTAYNREKYIAEAIESVLASSFTDFELIIVDDGSKDRTVEIAQRYSSDARVRLHVNAKNLGDYPNRNRAAELASGRYLKYVDADDLIYPHGLEVMVRAMEKFPKAAFGISRPEYTIDGKPYPLQLSPQDIYRRHFLKGGFLGNAPLSAIISAAAFHTVGGFSGRQFVGDTELWLKLGAKYPVAIFLPALTWWRSHEEQETKYELRSYDALNLRFEVSKSALSAVECPLSETERCAAIRFLKRNHMRFILGHLARGRAVVAWRVFQGSSLSWMDLPNAFRGVRP